VRARLLRYLKMNEIQQETDVAVEGMTLHWTYRVLRRLAYLGAATIFWAWVIFLALSGNF